jgi:hypothetical protein
MTSRSAILFLTLTTALAIGCGKSDQPVPLSGAPSSTPSAAAEPAATPGIPASSADSDIIRQAVEDHVRDNHGINMSAMDMSVEAVSVTGDKAQANAVFRVKQGGTSMAMTYSLERHGNGWLVVHSAPSDGQFVHPPMDKTHSGTSAGAPPASGTPDVTDFLKNHPAPNHN